MFKLNRIAGALALLALAAIVLPAAASADITNIAGTTLETLEVNSSDLRSPNHVSTAIHPLGDLALKRGVFYTMTPELQRMFERPNCASTRLPNGKILGEIDHGVSRYNCSNNGTCTCNGAYDCVHMIAADGACQEGTVLCNGEYCTCNEGGTQCPFDDCSDN